MTEYDSSPAAHARAMATHNRVSNWVSSQSSSKPRYTNPFALTKSEYASRQSSPLYSSPRDVDDQDFPGSPGLYAMELERRGRDNRLAGGGSRRRSASVNTGTNAYAQAQRGYGTGAPAYYAAPPRLIPPTRSKTYSTPHSQRPPPHLPAHHPHSQSVPHPSHTHTTSPRRSASQSSRHTRHTRSPPNSHHQHPQQPPPPPPQPQQAYYYPHPPQPPKVIYLPPHQAQAQYYEVQAAREAKGYVYLNNNKINASTRTVQMPHGHQAWVYPAGDVKIIPPTHQQSPHTLKKKSVQPFLKRLFTGWGRDGRDRERRRRMSY